MNIHCADCIFCFASPFDATTKWNKIVGGWDIICRNLPTVYLQRELIHSLHFRHCKTTSRNLISHASTAFCSSGNAHLEELALLEFASYSPHYELNGWRMSAPKHRASTSALWNFMEFLQFDWSWRGLFPTIWSFSLSLPYVVAIVINLLNSQLTSLASTINKSSGVSKYTRKNQDCTSHHVRRVLAI
jgi:hypothetical protein